MKHVAQVEQVQVHQFSDDFQEFAAVVAFGQVSTTGWTHIRLSPRFYISPPADGIWDLDLLGDPPVGIVGQVVLPVSAQDVFFAPTWFQGVRVHSASNDVVAHASHSKITRQKAPVFAAKPHIAGHVIIHHNLISFDDSIKPTGIHWHGVTPHIRMKKLHHELVLTVEGPDEGRIKECINAAIAAALLSAIAESIVTGCTTLPASVSAFLSTITGCLGNSYTARINDKTHWIHWDI
jgi:hypothetical protein